ncbi:MAG: class I SAM-dependent methyltransferase [Bacteroidetes bacterium]|nr:class I SAM-dependent methyltransferase [Bacteroidota bacterium]
MTEISKFLLYDELPLWSAPFGMTLLDTLRIRKGMNILDIGSGAGFPMLEIAERAGNRCTVYGVDPSEDSFGMISEKISIKNILNAIIKIGVAEELPFPDQFFDAVTANNGMNNVANERKALSECFRVMKPGAQLVITMNLPHTFVEFYEVFEEILQEQQMTTEVLKLKQHINAKRKPVEYWKELILETGFLIRSINVDGFRMKLTDGTAFLHHSFIRAGFRGPWEEVTKKKEVFTAIEERLNALAAKNGELILSVPFACFDCTR